MSARPEMDVADSCVPGKDGWNQFAYHLYKHSGWLTRRVEHVSYAGDSLWQCDVSLDLDLGCLQKYYERYCLKKDDSTEVVPAEELRFRASIPLFEQDKCKQLISFDLRDREGRAMSLLSRAASAQICLSILDGAMKREHASDPLLADFLTGNPLPATFSAKRSLFYALGEWFRDSDPLGRGGMGYVHIDDPNGLTGIREAFVRFLGGLAVDRGWVTEELELVEAEFNNCWRCSRIFRYFVHRYAYKWLVCCVIDNAPEFSIVKYRYLISRDIAHDSAAHWYSTAFKGIIFEYDLSGVGMAEATHVTVAAPKGLVLAPPPLPLGLLARRKEPYAHCYVRDDPYPAMVWNRDWLFYKRKDESDIETEGSVTPRYATLRAVYPWREGDPETDDFHEDTKRVRRLPVEGCREHRYLFVLGFWPKIGTREIGQTALLALTSLVLLACMFFPDFFLRIEDFSLASFIALVQVVIAVIALRDEPSYLRRSAARLPGSIFWVTVGMDLFVVLMLFALTGQVDALSGFEVPGWLPMWLVAWLTDESLTTAEQILRFTSLVLFVVCALLVVIQVFWLFSIGLTPKKVMKNWPCSDTAAIPIYGSDGCWEPNWENELKRVLPESVYKIS